MKYVRASLKLQGAPPETFTKSWAFAPAAGVLRPPRHGGGRRATQWRLWQGGSTLAAIPGAVAAKIIDALRPPCHQ
jgi:hypothetical protein